MKKITAILITCVFISACGFTPIYSSNSQNEQMKLLSSVSISNIPDREGQYLRNALIDRFYSKGYPVNTDYTLNISSIKESISDLDITKNSDATRAQLRLKTNMALIDNSNNEVVLTRSLNAISSYNVLTSEFATRVSEQSTRENALDDIARQIEMQTQLFLR